MKNYSETYWIFMAVKKMQRFNFTCMKSRWFQIFLAAISVLLVFNLLIQNNYLLQKIWEQRKLAEQSYDDGLADAAFSNNHSNTFKLFMVNDRHVRKCLNGKIIGAVPKDIKLESYKAMLNTLNPTMTEEKELWGAKETSISGKYSEYYWTLEIVSILNVIINQLKAILKKSRIRMMDIPCGEMLWMTRLLESRNDIDYTGVDIVPELIDRHKKYFYGKPYNFENANILEVGFKQQYDLVFSRHMLQHLNNNDIDKFLKMASESGSNYLLATTFPAHPFNKEMSTGRLINPGRYRPVNLEIPPFSLSPPICTQPDGPSSDEASHHISLWKLPLQRVTLCRNPYTMLVKDSTVPFHACGLWGKDVKY